MRIVLILNCCFRVRRCERSNPFATQQIVIPAKAGIQYAAAYRFNHCCLWNTGSPALRRAMTTEYDSAFSRRDAPEVCKIIRPKKRGRRECRVLAAPAVSCAKVRKKAHTSIQVQSEHSGIPCAMVLRLMPRSPRRRIRLASVAGELMARLARLGFANLRQLDASHGRQDHTVLPYAAQRRLRLRVCACSLTDQGPPCEHDHAPDAAASTASRPNVRDDGQRPSTGTGWREL